MSTPSPSRCARRAYVLLLSLLSVACSSRADERVEVTIGAARACAAGLQPPRMVPVGTDTKGQNYTLDDEHDLTSIPWGSEHRAELRIRRHSSSVALGGRSIHLARVTSSVSKAGDARVLPSHRSCVGADRRSFIDGQPFRCASPEICRALDTLLDAPRQEPFELLARLPATPGEPLVIDEVRTGAERTCTFYPCTPK